MNISEMHLQVDLGLNNLNSSLYGNTLPQEKDWALNNAQLRFIKQRYNPQSNRFGKGLEMSQKRYDDLRNVHVKYYIDNTYTTEENNMFRFNFPSDYMFLTSQRSRSKYNNCLSAITPIITSSINYYWIIPLITTDDTYVNFDIKTVSPISSIFSSVSTFSNYSFNDSYLFFLKINSIISNPSYEFYWETYKTVYSKNSIIIVWNNGTVPTSNDNLKIGTTTYTYTQITTQSYSASTDNTELVPNRICQIDDIYVIKNDPFNSTIYYNPLTVSAQNYIDVYTNSTFLVDAMVISYIKYPAVLSYDLQQSCELSNETHQEIVNLAVNILIENLESRRLGTQTQQLLTEE